MKENLVFDELQRDELETIATNVYQPERLRIKRKSALFVPNHRLFRNEILEELDKLRHLHYPNVKMPEQQTRYIKGKDNDCL